MAETLVGIRLALRGRRETEQGIRDVADQTRRVGDEARTTGRSALSASRGLAAMADRRITAGIRGTVGAVGGLAGALKGPLVGGAKAAGLAVAGTAVGLGALALKSVAAASEANETGSAFGTVYGAAATAAQSWIDTQSKAFGLNSTEMQQALVGFGGLGKQIGLTGGDLAKFGTDLTGAALDLGSFWNVSSEDALGAIQSGLTGEGDGLKQFGIFMSDASLSAFALSKGITKTTDTMSEQEKIALRQQFILSSLGDAQGDLARTSGGLANQQRALSGRWTTAKQILGKGLTPAAAGLTTALNTGLSQAIDWATPRMDGLSAAAQRVGDRFVAAGQQVPGLLAAIKSGDTSGIAGVLDTMAGTSGAAVGPITTALDTIVAKGREVAQVGPAVKAGFDAMPISPLKLLGDALSWAADNAGLVRSVLTVVLPLWGAYRVAVLVSTAASKAYAAGAAVVTAAQWLWNAALAANPIVLVAIAIAALVAGLVVAYQKVGWFRDAVDAVWSALKTAGEWLWNTVAPFTPLGAAIHLVTDHLDDLKDALGWAWDKLKSLWDLAKQAGGAISAIGNFFGIGGGDDDGGGSKPAGRYNGGAVKAGTPYIVGERRPELFVPQVSGRILPRVPKVTDDATSGMLPVAAPAAQQPVHVHLMLDGRELGSAVVNDLRRQVARR